MQYFIMPNGDSVPVPREVSGQGVAAEVAFYDQQLARVAAEQPTAPVVPAGSPE
jgi:hypothetical protein